MFRKHGLYENPDRVVIFCEEDSLITSFDRGLCLCFFSARLINDRQIDMKCRSPVRFAVDSNIAIMLLYDPIHCREAETGAFPHLLGCEEGIKYL